MEHEKEYVMRKSFGSYLTGVLIGATLLLITPLFVPIIVGYMLIAWAVFILILIDVWDFYHNTKKEETSENGF